MSSTSGSENSSGLGDILDTSLPVDNHTPINYLPTVVVSSEAERNPEQGTLITKDAKANDEPWDRCVIPV